MKEFLDGTKRMIALILTITFAGVIVYAAITDKKVPDQLTTIVAMVIGYYFGNGQKKID